MQGLLAGLIAVIVVVLIVLIKGKSAPAPSSTVGTNTIPSTGNAQVDTVLNNVLTDAQLAQNTISGIQDILNAVNNLDSAGASGGGDPTIIPPADEESVVEDYSDVSLPIMTFKPTVAASIRSAGQSPKGIDKYNEFFIKYGDIWGVSPILLKAVCQTESTGNPLAFNPVAVDYHDRSWTSYLHTIWKQIRSEILSDNQYGLSTLTKYKMDPSMGLMQVRYSTGYGLNNSVFPVDLFDGEISIALGARFISGLQNATGDIQNNIDAYNMGLGNWMKGKRNLDYLTKVQNNIVKFKDDF